ncbi:hypothetical protein [Bordetella avium]|uniref:hypothetical protein n=1 Tax=Bordetella avium TaxID=521 RepID=UPI000E0C76AD|nr:hypothetical protein [Bordetella avium]AZY54241.1 hypothetical protein C0J07_06370 [Bordetella avium]RIQ14322.1 hypothetical protein D0432_07520 [Bordetella avium]RIQ17974.1 hypothetical protein D0850_07450 [Bordetella avium]RIQ36674.1 hypothetical protein D0849_01930 [Bordetella avium]RIQ39800.1 hypothetical protein D0848_05510 [Bordetella avium]
METELDGRLLALRQALAISIALSTRGHTQATDMALELLNDLRSYADNSPFDQPVWVQGAQNELEEISRLVRAFTQSEDDAS